MLSFRLLIGLAVCLSTIRAESNFEKFWANLDTTGDDLCGCKSHMNDLKEGWTIAGKMVAAAVKGLNAAKEKRPTHKRQGSKLERFEWDRQAKFLFTTAAIAIDVASGGPVPLAEQPARRGEHIVQPGELIPWNVLTTRLILNGRVPSINERNMYNFELILARLQHIFQTDTYHKPTTFHCGDSCWKRYGPDDADVIDPTKKVKDVLNPVTNKLDFDHGYYYFNGIRIRASELGELGLCRGTSSHMIKTAGYELLTVCDRAWKELKVKTLPEEAREGDSLDDRKYFTLARVLIHELVHLVTDMIDPPACQSDGQPLFHYNPIRDGAGNTIPATVPSTTVGSWIPENEKVKWRDASGVEVWAQRVETITYGMELVANLAKNHPILSVWAPDTWALYCEAMYYSNWDWSSGKAVRPKF
ncbi:uncharacterized protein GGS25DRAFT_533504 [Hypoxylon fragiforme]|uniref:uncharacterized protein n=1 Tax=Hypoxylon fragiforme TaxID=63214 RepID=UPI0020C73A40|nr:uncharacterized protein GGS25DRAFT_533504 [Hypoxylon fragiforme]KAI2606419.1 hypothetical protein GGS25DRAFT_533504 [Hypoxylon fragiforme]